MIHLTLYIFCNLLNREKCKWKEKLLLAYFPKSQMQINIRIYCFSQVCRFCMRIIVLLSLHNFLSYYNTGAIHFFKKLDIGSLDIADYLGTLRFKFVSQNIFLFSLIAISFLVLSSWFAAIGAIFSATDSVCTLQVRMALPSRDPVTVSKGQNFHHLFIQSDHAGA